MPILCFLVLDATSGKSAGAVAAQPWKEWGIRLATIRFVRFRCFNAAIGGEVTFFPLQFIFMNKSTIKLANKKLKLLLRRYKGFNTVFLDNWRGFRFIYDSKEIKSYPGKSFLQSRLFELLKNENPGKFTASLCRASVSDKKLFGLQYFLNCKTYRQYAKCYINFFIKKVRTKEQAADEILLLKNMKIVFSKEGNLKVLERQFRLLVLTEVLSKCKKKEVRNEVENYLEKGEKWRALGGAHSSSPSTRRNVRLARTGFNLRRPGRAD